MMYEYVCLLIHDMYEPAGSRRRRKEATQHVCRHPQQHACWLRQQQPAMVVAVRI